MITGGHTFNLSKGEDYILKQAVNSALQNSGHILEHWYMVPSNLREHLHHVTSARMTPSRDFDKPNRRCDKQLQVCGSFDCQRKPLTKTNEIEISTAPVFLLTFYLSHYVLISDCFSVSTVGLFGETLQGKSASHSNQTGQWQDGAQGGEEEEQTESSPLSLPAQNQVTIKLGSKLTGLRQLVAKTISLSHFKVSTEPDLIYFKL